MNELDLSLKLSLDLNKSKVVDCLPGHGIKEAFRQQTV